MRHNRFKPRHILLALTAFLAALAFLPPAARAHAFLDHSEPKVGSEVDKAPAEVVQQQRDKLAELREQLVSVEVALKKLG